MSVVSLRVHRIPIALRRPFVTAVRRAEAIDVVLVEARDDTGRTGWGEAAASWRVTGESPESITTAVEGPIAEAVVGRPAEEAPAAIAAAVWGNAAARSAAECAVLSLSDEPLAAVLGATTRTVRTDMTLSAAPAEEVVARAVGHLAEGFTTLKLKASRDHDTARTVRELRAAVGDGIALRLDANQAWTAEEAIGILRDCEPFGVELVEQPVAAADIDGLAAVRRGIGIPVLADESVRTAADVARIARAGAADAVNLKLAKTGGPLEALRAARTARAAGLGVIIGCMMEGPVGISAAAALAAAVAPDAVNDLDAGLWLARSPIRGGARYERDALVLPEAPGLGITAVSDITTGA